MLQPTLKKLVEALQYAWADDTCINPADWSEDNPARGQCVGSSLVMQDYLGGDLLRYRVSADGINETHYCNILEDGTIIDTTGQQYKVSVILQIDPVQLKSFHSIREKRLADDGTRKRYEILASRVSQYLLSTD